MDLFYVVLLFIILIAILDSIRRVNISILKQTEELKKIREELHNNKKD